MTPYEVKQYMKQGWKLRIELVAKYESVYTLRSLAEKATSTFSPVPSSPSSESKVEHYAIRMVEMQMDIEECVDRIYEIQQKTLKMIELASDPLARAILTEYHINGKTLDATAEGIGYSTRQTINIMNKAYQEISDNISLNFTIDL